MRLSKWSAPSALCVAVLLVLGGSGCKSVSERYIQLEVWKYEKCFGHLPPGFIPPGGAAPAARPCGQNAGCPPAPCQTASFSPGGNMGGENCDQCQGAVSGTIIENGGQGVPGLPSGPGGSPGPMPRAGSPTPAGVTTSRPIIISDEVVLP